MPMVSDSSRVPVRKHAKWQTQHYHVHDGVTWCNTTAHFIKFCFVYLYRIIFSTVWRMMKVDYTIAMITETQISKFSLALLL